MYRRFAFSKFYFSWLVFATIVSFCLDVAAQSTTILRESGILQSGDETASDGSLYDLYTFEGEVGQVVILRMESSDFDTYIGLFSSSGSLLAENDDIRQGTTNSEIRVRLPESGTYTVIANAFDPSERGSYVLAVTASGSAESTTSQRASAETGARPGFEIYRHQNIYTIEYPENWHVESVPRNGQNAANIWSQRPTGYSGDWSADLVKTEVVFFDADFEPFIRGFFTDSVITRRGDLTVGGLPAVRIWADSSHGTGIHTFIRPANGTTIIVLSSYYASDAYINEIQDIHWSFRLID